MELLKINEIRRLTYSIILSMNDLETILLIQDTSQIMESVRGMVNTIFTRAHGLLFQVLPMMESKKSKNNLNIKLLEFDLNFRVFNGNTAKKKF